MEKKEKKERISSGIPGLDDLIKGGFPKHSLTLLTGTAGTGKTIAATQFIYEGAFKFNEPGVYISFEEPIENIKENAKAFGWDIEKLEKEKKIIFLRYDPFHIEDVYELIESSIRRINAQRVVIDSISALGLYIRDAPELRRMIFNIGILLRKLGCTTILTSEILPTQRELSRFGVEEFIADGVIVFYYLKTDSKFSRSLTVWKMRGTEHSQTICPYKITSKGITVFSKEVAYAKG